MSSNFSSIDFNALGEAFRKMHAASSTNSWTSYLKLFSDHGIKTEEDRIKALSILNDLGLIEEDRRRVYTIDLKYPS